MAIINIIGLDPGTANTGWSNIVGDPTSGIVRLNAFSMLATKKDVDGDVRERIDKLGYGLRKLVETHRPTHLAIEDFTEQGKLVGKTYKEMSWLTEHFRMVGRELGLEVAVYTNAYWKKVLLKTAHASKAQVEHYVSHRLPESRKLLTKQPNHVWDSVAIGLCTFNLSTGGNNIGNRTAKRKL